MSLYSMFAGRGPSGFGYGSTAEDVTAGVSLVGKTILVTGITSGIGSETARVLALRGAHVIGTARTAARATEALSSVGARESTGLACELADPASILDCIARVKTSGRRLDAMIANAGIMALPELKKAHGYELQFLTNHVGHFALVTGLLGALAEEARVVIVASTAHRRAPAEGIDFDNLRGERSYDPWAAYGRSKLANILFAKELARRFEGTQRTANACHPGVIATGLTRSMSPLAGIGMRILSPIALKSIPQGAATQCWLAAHPSTATLRGEYSADCNVGTPRRLAEDAALARKLWERTEEIVREIGAVA